MGRMADAAGPPHNGPVIRTLGGALRALVASMAGSLALAGPVLAHGETAPAPELPKIKDGEPGAGQYLLPVERNQSPVGADLLNDIMRVPEQQRLPLIINELGAGLSGNGEALQAALRRASPALQQADELVAILARQNTLLAKLTYDSDTVLKLAEQWGLAGAVRRLVDACQANT